MITKTQEIYRCEHCKKYYLSKYFAERHELMCKMNPVNFRPCFECKFLINKYQTESVDSMYEDGRYKEDEITYKLLFCEKKEMFLYPPKVEIKGNSIELAYDENNPMPKECELAVSWLPPKNKSIEYFENDIF